MRTACQLLAKVNFLPEKIESLIQQQEDRISVSNLPDGFKIADKSLWTTDTVNSED
jgi:hypothetical protein